MLYGDGYFCTGLLRRKAMRIITLTIILLSLLVILPVATLAKPVTEIAAKERCPVCGMFVAKYRPWLAQIQMVDGSTVMFDGVKDMLAYYFEPSKYGGKSAPEDVYVTDYYTQKWVDGKKAYYVIGSDTLGPMGHEFIPLSSKNAAETFLKDHKGESIFTFDDIGLELVNKMRTGKAHAMKK